LTISNREKEGAFGALFFLNDIISYATWAEWLSIENDF